jgi:hypothetical protein
MAALLLVLRLYHPTPRIGIEAADKEIYDGVLHEYGD